ncbi:transcription initiation factor TFIID subunit 11 [Nymphaea colorata]|nr:transcription initiation factor TFIID subunit 11 [Nymphaea colorata]
MEDTVKQQATDPFEVAFADQDSPPESPIREAPATNTHDQRTAAENNRVVEKNKEEEEEEEEENVDSELGKFQTGDPDKTAKMQAILSQFTEEQMSRYESFRRSGFQKATMRRLLMSIAGCPISMPMTIVMSGIAKMFVGELVETGRIVMNERKENGPIRPCHIREAYRRLKSEGKIPRRSRQRLFP